jgi:hypothetical protein
MVIHKAAAALAALILIFAALSPAAARDRNLILLNVSHSDIDDFDEPTVEGNIEYAWNRTVFGNDSWFSGIGPAVGLTVTGKGGVFGYAALYGDFFIGDSFVIRPEGGMGAFTRGAGKDLGGTFEIHGSLTVAYIFANEARLGVTFSHISNGGVYDSSPALDSILLNYSFPIGPIF